MMQRWTLTSGEGAASLPVAEKAIKQLSVSRVACRIAATVRTLHHYE